MIQPTIIKDYPRDMSPFAKRIRGDDAPADEKERRYIESHTERFEFFIAGMEMGNAFTELNDPRDQQERFVEMKRLYAEEADETTPLDEDYLRAMRYGMPPNGGFGSGVDRMVMLLTDQTSIRDVLLYPHLRSQQLTEADLRGQFMLDAAVRGFEYRLDHKLDGSKRKIALLLPAPNVGIEFRLANALDGSLAQLQNLRAAFGGDFYVMTEDALYTVGDDSKRGRGCRLLAVTELMLAYFAKANYKIRRESNRLCTSTSSHRMYSTQLSSSISSLAL